MSGRPPGADYAASDPGVRGNLHGSPTRRAARAAPAFRPRPLRPLSLLALLPARRAASLPRALLPLPALRQQVRCVGDGLDAGSTRPGEGVPSLVVQLSDGTAGSEANARRGPKDGALGGRGMLGYKGSIDLAQIAWLNSKGFLGDTVSRVWALREGGRGRVGSNASSTRRSRRGGRDVTAALARRKNLETHEVRR
jgi:hypothetical protein